MVDVRITLKKGDKTAVLTDIDEIDEGFQLTEEEATEIEDELSCKAITIWEFVK